ncbi:hypothetical protein NPIL_374911 [Nephila pilipes]|uniref:Uncharacterized protein n=1 Tax=Nephila pilipes TaxID=299642 RepID=A0A8X6TBH1_NEPPI|nr:hypothetical protein NPIL_374911 [Nephila pilipes]
MDENLLEKIEASYPLECYPLNRLTRKPIILLKLLCFIMNSCQRFSNKTRPWKGTNFETVFTAESLLKRLANAPKLEPHQRPKDLTIEAIFVIFLFFIFVGLSAIGTLITVFENFQRDRVKRKSSTDGNIPKKVVFSERKKT